MEQSVLVWNASAAGLACYATVLVPHWCPLKGKTRFPDLFRQYFIQLFSSTCKAENNREIFCLLVHSANSLNSQPRARTQELPLCLHLSIRRSNTWTIIFWLTGWINMKLNQNFRKSRGSDWHSSMRCGHPMQQLNKLLPTFQFWWSLVYCPFTPYPPLYNLCKE